MRINRPIFIGQRFGRLVVLSEQGKPDPYRRFICRCDCGNEPVVIGAQLNKGTISCGCAKGRKPSHGMSRTPEYRLWARIRERCEDPKNKDYEDYGARGIRVCERWKTFENFFSDVGKIPPGLSLDRYPNNDGNYEPGNTRWATSVEQQRNTRANRLLTYQGVTATVSEWSERTGLRRGVLFNRLHHGWPTERVLTETVRSYPSGK